ncbi:MAG: FAD-binding oxidoreductase [Rhodospirillaceae bacterium]|nr:FAD-binding oxidoreductase [Rhodospirillaceae bacterium]
MQNFDVIIVGAGAVGASLAYRLAPHRRVLMVEREEQPGYHSTGRSAAHYTDVIGGTEIQALSEETRSFIDNPPEGFSDAPLLNKRAVLLLISDDTADAHFDEESLSHVMGRILFPIDLKTCLEHCPVLRADKVARGIWEPEAGDIDVHAIHGGYLRLARKAGAELVCDADVLGLERRDGAWQVESRAGSFSAPLVVNCTGAWGDVLGEMAGASPVGLQPMRRTAFTFKGPEGMDCTSWPLTSDDGESFYFKPEAGLIMGSLADETPSDPCDARPDELDLAQAAHNIMEWTTLDIRRMESRWAGLRSFVADRLPVTGYDPKVEGFFWNIGQGGAGIQTSAGLSAYAAAVILEQDLPEGLTAAGFTAETLSPARITG